MWSRQENPSESSPEDRPASELPEPTLFRIDINHENQPELIQECADEIYRFLLRSYRDGKKQVQISIQSANIDVIKAVFEALRAINIQNISRGSEFGIARFVFQQPTTQRQGLRNETVQTWLLIFHEDLTEPKPYK